MADFSFDLPEPPQTEVKPDFATLPFDIRNKIEHIIDSRIVSSDIARGGYSPAASFFITCENRNSYYIKGSHPDEMAHGAKMLDQEIDIYKRIKAVQKIAPQYIGRADEMDEDGWHLGIWQKINAHIETQWHEKHFRSFGETYTSLLQQDSILNPAFQTPFVKDILSGRNSWQKMRDFTPRQDGFITLFADKKAAREWLKTALPLLIKSSLKPVPVVDHILHFDLRSDNILFDNHGRCFIIDWPNACIGNGLYDLITLSCELAARQNQPPQDIFKQLRNHLPQSFCDDQETLVILLSKLSGYYALNAYRDVPEKLPRLRWMQKAILNAALFWLFTLNHIPLCPSYEIDSNKI